MKIFKISSFNFYIEGFNRDIPNSIGKISNMLLNYIWDSVLTDYDKSYWKEMSKFQYYDIASPSNNAEYDSPTGDIDFLTSGIDPRKIDEIVVKTKQWLDAKGIKANVSIGKSKSEYIPNEDAILIEIIGNNAPKIPEINMSNDNAFFIFQKVLGYNVDLWKNGTFDAQELKNRINYYLGEDKLPEGKAPKVNKIDFSKLTDGTEETGTMLAGYGANSHYNEEDVRRRLSQIKDYCTFALSKGFNKIYVA